MPLDLTSGPWVAPPAPINPEAYPNAGQKPNAPKPTPEMLAMLSGVKPAIENPKAGTILRYKPGTKENTRIPVYADGVGGEFDGEEAPVPATPGSTGFNAAVPERTLARDTFANTLSLVFGVKEASQPYVGKLYELVSGFYKTGSTVDEALNLALYEAHAKNVIPEFTKRFAGIFALQDQLNAGAAITVPSIAEFIATEAKMGEVLTNAGLGELANQDFLGGIIGKGKSVLEVGNLISDVFSTIDNAPVDLKKDLQTYFPGVDRTSIAKALLTGTDGASALSKKVKGISVMSAAGSQGVNVNMATAADIAAQGYDYQQSLTGFGQVKNLERANTLASLRGGQFTQEQAQGAVFGKSIQQQNEIERIRQEEQGRWQGSAGAAQGAFSTGYLKRSSAAGLI